MNLVEYSPAEALRPYIDAYWVIHTDTIVRRGAREFFADGYIDLIINMGSSSPLVNNAITLAPGRMYLNSAMRSSLSIADATNSRFLGVRFKPGGFPVLYHCCVEEMVDQVFNFHDPQLQLLIDNDERLFARLDQYFLSRIRQGYYPVIMIAETVKKHKGQLSVDMLAKHHHVTNRTLERLFNTHTGVSPKEFISVIRFQSVLGKLMLSSGDSLFGIAVEAGYYDHAHMTREVKKMTGHTPSEIIQSFQAYGSMITVQQ